MMGSISPMMLGCCMQGFTDELTAEPTWMCDPVDGTTNFVHSFPFVCVCIGLAIEKQVGSFSLVLLVSGLIIAAVVINTASRLAGIHIQATAEQLEASSHTLLLSAGGGWCCVQPDHGGDVHSSKGQGGFP